MRVIVPEPVASVRAAAEIHMAILDGSLPPGVRVRQEEPRLYLPKDPKIKSSEYYQNGAVKRVEFWGGAGPFDDPPGVFKQGPYWPNVPGTGTGSGFGAPECVSRRDLSSRPWGS